MKDLLKISGAVILAVSLVGCGSVSSIKQDPSDSDSKQFMNLLVLKNDSFVLDGVTPESAKVEVPESLLQKYNGSTARHAVNFLVGGVSGLVSLGTIQATTRADYITDYNFLNTSQLIVVDEYKKPERTLYGDVYRLFDEVISSEGKNLNYSLNKDGFLIGGNHFITGGDCKLESCMLNLAASIIIMEGYDYNSFPASLKPEHKQEKGYNVNKFALREYVNYNKATNIGVPVDNSKTLRAVLSKLALLENRQNSTFFLYLAAKHNNGIPVIIDESGKEHYFVKK